MVLSSSDAERRHTAASSQALWESRPRVELSQHMRGACLSYQVLCHVVHKGERSRLRLTCVAMTSAMDTRLRSPPDTPRTKSPPTMVLCAWEIPRDERMDPVICETSSFEDARTPLFRVRSLSDVAKRTVCATVRVAQCRSSKRHRLANPGSFWHSVDFQDLTSDLPSVFMMILSRIALACRGERPLNLKVPWTSSNSSSWFDSILSSDVHPDPGRPSTRSCCC